MGGEVEEQVSETISGTCSLRECSREIASSPSRRFGLRLTMLLAKTIPRHCERSEAISFEQAETR